MSIIINGGQPFFQQETYQTLEKKEVSEEVVQNDNPTKNQLLEEMIKELHEVRKNHVTQLKFEYHEGLQEYFMSIVDRDTQEVLKEIPAKKLLDLYAAIQKNIGLVVDQKV
ncbi:flagellar protein FlaG [Bacillus sp. AGMB 02131]|uniref:Flagellar protein FlaG n=1 Tax=Peribacillus faecalis TaxID=2772559 RepID=A0A927CXE1_9BACI|nr:flagellar protein FlaG [Peribacillus faecalis]MBD3108492.1 flagellar protein FlaG [Peribacillus faecalis]